MEGLLKRKLVIQFHPLIIGFLIYFLLLPPALLGLGEGIFQIILLISHVIGGFYSGKKIGYDGVYGIMTFSAIILIGYFLFNLISPDGLWIIGFFFLGFTQALFWGGWLFGVALNK